MSDNKMNKESKLGLTYMIIVFTLFVFVPYYCWIKTDARAEQLQSKITQIDKLIEENQKLTKDLYKTIEVRDEYANKYCLAVKFSTKDCKKLMETKIKNEVNEAETLKDLTKDNDPLGIR